MTRILRVVVLIVMACAPKEAPPPPRCESIPRDQNRSIDRYSTCLERELRAALILCENEKPLVPIPAKPPWTEGAPGLSVDECLRKWMPNLAACPDEPDRQWECELRAASIPR